MKKKVVLLEIFAAGLVLAACSSKLEKDSAFTKPIDTINHNIIDSINSYEFPQEQETKKDKINILSFAKPLNTGNLTHNK